VRLRQRFPELQPIARAPLLFLLRDTGVALTGQRGEDAETGTCIKTLTIRFFGIPLVLLRAYRVLEWQQCRKQASTGQGEGASIARWCELKVNPRFRSWPPREGVSYHFIGREALSGTSRLWNALVASLTATLIVTRFIS
jgi:hypothetical protein